MPWNLLGRLGPQRLAAVVQLLETFLVEDRDTLSDAERKAISEADQWLQHNQPTHTSRFWLSSA